MFGKQGEELSEKIFKINVVSFNFTNTTTPSSVQERDTLEVRRGNDIFENPPVTTFIVNNNSKPNTDGKTRSDDIFYIGVTLSGIVTIFVMVACTVFAIKKKKQREEGSGVSRRQETELRLLSKSSQI